VPDPLSPLTVPFVTLIPAAFNPLTASEKVMVNGIDDRFVGSAAEVASTALGIAESKLRESVAEARLALPAVSAPAPAGSAIEKGPWAVGVRVIE
jgi:hypothetical protein